MTSNRVDFSKRKRRFTDPPCDQRCEWTVKMPDGSDAQCGRRHTDGQLCTQHAKMRALWSCEYCGGNDSNPPEHCMDCSRNPLAGQTHR